MKIQHDVLIELSQAEVSPDGLHVRLSRQIDRKLYQATNKVLTALGGAWNRKLGAHVFTEDATQGLERALLSGEIATHADLGFFQTPGDLACELVRRADVRRGYDTCLEPSAGMGRIVDALLQAGGAVTAIERHPSRRAHLKQRWTADAALVVDDCDDFMTFEPGAPFDRVVMNPPFVQCGLGDHLDHVRHAFELLVPGGILVAVLPHGVVFRGDQRHRTFRAWVSNLGEIAALPADSFKESGTDVSTCRICLVAP